VKETREAQVPLGGGKGGHDPLAVPPKGQLEPGFVPVAAGKTALVCGFIIEFVVVLHGLRPVYQPIWRESVLDRRSEALAQLLETALSERFATPVIELLQATPIPVAVVQVTDLRVLALNELMARLFHRPDAAGMTISALLPPAQPLSDPRPYRSVSVKGRAHNATLVLDAQTLEWFILPLTGGGRTVDHLLT